MKTPALHGWRRFAASPLLCFGLAWLLTQLDVVERVEWRTLDWRTNVRVHFQPPPDPRIAVVLFGDATEMNLVAWPPDRAVHGELINLLTLAKPAAVIWDVILDASREGGGDAAMARAANIARRSGVKVVTASVTNPDPAEAGAEAERGPTEPLRHVEGEITRLLGDADALRPFPALRKESWYGFADTPAGEDGLRRRIPLLVRVGEAVYPSLALQALLTYFDAPADAVRVRLGDAIYLPTKDRGELRVPIARDGRFLLNYRYDQNEAGPDFPTYGYGELMITLTDQLVNNVPSVRPPPRLDGRIVFIGQVVTGKADIGPTPRNPAAPLVLVHANVVNNVLTGDYARVAPGWAVWLGALLVGYGGLALGLRRPIAVEATFTVLVVACYAVLAFAAWIKFSLWLPLLGPIGGFLALQFTVIFRRALAEQRAREQVKQMFGTYLSPVLLERMMRSGRNIATVSSERRPVTILFSDLRNFTSLTESLRDDLLIAQLNEYLEAMVECIHAEGGTLHKFIGDAVMAVWGDLASEGVAIDAQRAARAALAMQATLAQLNAKWQGEQKPPLAMGVGLNHGVVLIGNIGSPRRMEFAAIGDAVNLASRLESLNKELHTRILAGENLQPLLAEAFQLRPCGSLPVKGKAQPVRVFELLGSAS
ncbi:CHASE2 domain-containing protein [Opitutus terrae]|uniref:Adenylate/guanylate cyclase with Chase sensor n=1 Tax=Opitutus terrae (strain DSM 11246 / JCM 15787 / PB90-1) TaxID=452637 RepID=B1ZVB1_OPITP|nr:adenylate/guanylate cyclase domain-containing protein [Opitutus terrae]ACB76778.1 adenylate/guanylate cyclase with Chase sensor [Opitutus terrae PB90-1]